MVHVAVNKNMTLKKTNILEYAFGEGGGGNQKAYAVYAFINVDNCERPLRVMCCLVRVVIQCIAVHIVSRIYQGWWPVIATCRLWHRLLFGLVAICLFKKILMHYFKK